MLDRINVILHFTTNNRRWGGGTGRWPQHVNTYYKYKCKYKSIIWLQDQFTECFLTGWKVSKYGVSSSRYFHGFWLKFTRKFTRKLCFYLLLGSFRFKEYFIKVKSCEMMLLYIGGSQNVECNTKWQGSKINQTFMPNFLLSPPWKSFTSQKSYSFRSSSPEVFLVKNVLKICSKFTGEHPCQSVISLKLKHVSIGVLL